MEIPANLLPMKIYNVKRERCPTCLQTIVEKCLMCHKVLKGDSLTCRDCDESEEVKYFLSLSEEEMINHAI